MLNSPRLCLAEDLRGPCKRRLTPGFPRGNASGRGGGGGFTLIELLIVVAIIAILAAIAVPNFLEAQMRAKVTRTITDQRACAFAIEVYIIDNNQLPMAEDTSVYADFTWMIDFLMIEGSRLSHMGMLLTTPIAYLSQVPYDWFNSNQIRSSGFYQGYRGVSFVFSGVPKGGDPIRIHENQGFGLVHGQPSWFMESAGPDLRWATPEALDHPDRAARWFYDPTNGTISHGQIITFAGAYTIPRL